MSSSPGRVVVGSQERVCEDVRVTVMQEINAWLATDSRGSSLDERGRRKVNATGAAYVAALERILKANTKHAGGGGGEDEEGENENEAPVEREGSKKELKAMAKSVAELQQQVAELGKKLVEKRKRIPTSMADSASAAADKVARASDAILLAVQAMLPEKEKEGDDGPSQEELVDVFGKFMGALRTVSVEASSVIERAQDMVAVVDEKLAVEAAVQAGDPKQVAARVTVLAARKQGRGGDDGSSGEQQRKALVHALKKRQGRRRARSSKPY